MEVATALYFLHKLSSHLEKIVHCNSNRVRSLQVLQEIEQVTEYGFRQIDHINTVIKRGFRYEYMKFYSFQSMQNIIYK